MTERPIMRRASVTVLFVLFCLLSLVAAGDARAQAGLLVPTSTGRPDPAVLSLREMAVDVGIARGYARVNVRQVFENHTGTVQEGTTGSRFRPRRRWATSRCGTASCASRA